MVLEQIERLPVIKCGKLIVDPQCCTVTLNGKGIDLFPKEFDVLYLLVRYPNWVLPPDQIYEEVWHESMPLECNHVIYNAICQIRRKLGEPELIQTVVEHGYKFVDKRGRFSD